MILCTSQQREQKIFDWVQTMSSIEDARDLRIVGVTPTKYGFYIIYNSYEYDQWFQHTMKLYNSQILLIESLNKL